MLKCQQQNISHQNKQVKDLMFHKEHCLTGVTVEKSNPLEQKEIIEDILPPVLSRKNKKIIDRKSVIVESQQLHKKKIWKDKLSTSEINSLTIKLLKTLDQASTSKEKVLTPFWTLQSEETSKKLWLPTKIDYVDSVMNLSTESLESTPMGRSWFSIKKKHPLKKSSLMTSFQLSQFSLPDSMDSEAIQSKKKSKKKPLKKKKKKIQPPLKTLKFRLFPTEEEKEKLQLNLDQFRWYYNATVSIIFKDNNLETILKKGKYSAYSIRNKIRKYRFEEEETDEKIIKHFVYDENKNSIPIPKWWEKKVHSRLPRGASNKFTSSLNSAISNYKNGNISKFEMKYRSRKEPTDYLNFEDKAYPSFIKKIKSHYWFRNKQKKRVNISFKDVTTQARGIEIIYEKKTDRYFLHYPVDRDWFPDEDIRSENQAKYSSKSNRVISLDPGVRKFLVGYDPTGESIFIGENANKELINLMYKIDEYESEKKSTYLLWKEAKNLVSELHWKTIAFLIENYDIIILPEFKTQEMVRSKKIGKMTKRIMLMYSFFKFKEKLKYKCETYNKKLIIVDESFTSCTCTNCGKINSTKGKESLKCKSCNLSIDRDVAGSRNIFIKNVVLR